MYEVIAIGFAFCVFVLETIILAGNDWKVSRKTPVYNYNYKGCDGFCGMFWRTLFSYCVGVVGTLVLFSGVIGFITLFMGTPPVDTVMTALGMMILLVATVLVCVFAAIAAVVIPLCILSDKITDMSYQPDNKLLNGVSNWYSQIKDKYCPIITKEND